MTRPWTTYLAEAVAVTVTMVAALALDARWDYPVTGVLLTALPFPFIEFITRTWRDNQEGFRSMLVRNGSWAVAAIGFSWLAMEMLGLSAADQARAGGVGIPLGLAVALANGCWRTDREAR